jgi:predicted RNA-binding Zn ribbon-like protein
METRRISETDFAGGDLALDFVNTVGGLIGEIPGPEDDFLHSYEDVLTFAVKEGAVSKRQARRLARTARERPEEAGDALRAALRMRSLFDSVFRPLVVGEAPAPDALVALSELGAKAMSRGRLVSADGGFEWSWEDAGELEAPLWPIAHAAVELVRHGPLDRLKNCGRCRWIFLDATKNHSRRWCSMEGCGTHEKIERYVARRRERRASVAG